MFILSSLEVIFFFLQSLFSFALEKLKEVSYRPSVNQNIVANFFCLELAVEM